MLRLLRLAWLLLAGIGVGAVAFPAAGFPSAPPPVALLYIEANAGDASAGHAGLRVGREVFHYQYREPGLLLLERRSWDSFLHCYNDLGNRSLRELRLPLLPAAARRVRLHFSRRLIAQNRLDDALAELRVQLRLLEALRRAPGAGRERVLVELAGAGFFLAPGSSTDRATPSAAAGSGEPGFSPAAAIAALRREIARRLGEDYLASLERRLRRRLAEPPLSDGVACSVSAAPPAPAAGGRAAAEPAVSAAVPAVDLTAYRETLSLWHFVALLRRGGRLDPAALVEFPPLAAAAAARGTALLTPDERRGLAEWRRFFFATIITLLQSSRPDRGYPLHLALARGLAAERSLATGRLALLDATPPGALRVEALSHAGGSRNLALLTRAAARRVARLRRRLLTGGVAAGDERWWCAFENGATHWAELERCRAGARRRMRVYAGRPLPSRPAAVRLPVSPPAALFAAGRPGLEKRLARLQAERRRRYAYALLSRNCVTELLAQLRSALSSAPPAVIGGRFEPAALAGLSCIPWRMFAELRRRLPAAEIVVHPSLRQRRLKALYRRQERLPVYLRECNILTSTIYRRGGRERNFLFFTDDAGLLRPLFGTANLFWSLADAAWGLASSPCDRGRRLAEGISGAVFSLPELLFINLRKGSFVGPAAAAAP